MDALGTPTSGQRAALVFAFLQAEWSESEYSEELLSLGEELDLVRCPKSNGGLETDGHHVRSIAASLEDGGLETDGHHVCSLAASLEDGGLETDGHHVCSLAASLQDLRPSVELEPPRNRAVVQQVAEELREIAAQLELEVVSRSVQNLNSRISATPSDQWKHHLASEVQEAMKRGVGLEHLPTERVILALTLTLVKGVCEQAPRLLRSLFATTVQYLSPARAR